MFWFMLIICVVCLFCLYFFFFFKQKTAYEMRISDWSSDVCSSDLKMMQNMMTKDGKYAPSFAAALTAATAVIGPIIPPSIPMVLFALVSDASIGYLFLGGVVPGLLMALSQMTIVGVAARRRNFPVEPPTPLRALPGITWRAFPTL